MATPDFGSREFWEANALAPKDEYVEWFAGYAELVHVLRCACSPGSTVLHAGCGISSLSQALYDDGFRHQLAVDFSEQCMLKQRELCGPSRPEMGNAVMDCTKLGLRPASVDVCVDKGTLDALLCIDEGSEEAVAAMAGEVRRVLRPDGLWVIISVENNSAQPSASWGSGGCSQRQIMHRLSQASASQSAAWAALVGTDLVFHVLQVIISFNSPSTVVPVVEACHATALIACHALHSGNGVLYIYSCKLGPDEPAGAGTDVRSAAPLHLRACAAPLPPVHAASPCLCSALHPHPPARRIDAPAPLCVCTLTLTFTLTLASARRGWLRAVHGRHALLLETSAQDCRAWDQEGTRYQEGNGADAGAADGAGSGSGAGSGAGGGAGRAGGAIKAEGGAEAAARWEGFRSTLAATGGGGQFGQAKGRSSALFDDGDDDEGSSRRRGQQPTRPAWPNRGRSRAGGHAHGGRSAAAATRAAAAARRGRAAAWRGNAGRADIRRAVAGRGVARCTATTSAGVGGVVGCGGGALVRLPQRACRNRRWRAVWPSQGPLVCPLR